MKAAGQIADNWIMGCNSLLPPDKILLTQYAWAINVVNRGGIVQTRPGYNWRASIQGERCQGACIFTPLKSRPMMLVAVDGYIYAGKFPFNGAFTKIEGLKFDSVAPVMVLQPCLKSVELKPDGSLALLAAPKEIVIIQDGTTQAGVFDGETGFHSTEGSPFFGVPIGLWMEWTSSRLWIADKSRVKVSDLANPDTFSENTYIAERSNFELPGQCTGLIKVGDDKGLLAFTDQSTTAFKANIRDRGLWQVTPEFQKEILPKIGCVAGKSPINQYGLTQWMSQNGWVSIDAALFSQVSAKLVTIDGEMNRSKRIMAQHRDGICSGTIENFMMISVPAGGRYNEQTWVCDQAPIGQAGNGVDKAWVGVWMGTRPVEWMSINYGGQERLFFVSHDKTAKDGTPIHVWEAFRPSRMDNNGRIFCRLETGMMKGEDLARFRYAEIEVTELLGHAELKVWVGGVRGALHQILSTTLQAEIGSLGSPQQPILTKNSILQAYKPQTRFVATQEFSPQGRECSAEGEDIAGKDKGFQLVLEWRGRMGIKQIRIFTEPDARADKGQCRPSEAAESNAINAAGETIT